MRRGHTISLNLRKPVRNTDRYVLYHEVFALVRAQGGLAGYAHITDGHRDRGLHSVYGLAGAVWSKDEARAQRVARRIRAGQIDINGGAFNMNAPFGGFKQSGHGREAGVYGLEEFLEYKALQLK